MSLRVKVILDEEEAARFRMQAQKESKSLSAWLRDAGRQMLKLAHQHQPLTNPESLKQFFQQCAGMEEGTEPDWEEQKRIILEGYKTKHES